MILNEFCHEFKFLTLETMQRNHSYLANNDRVTNILMATFSIPPGGVGKRKFYDV